MLAAYEITWFEEALPPDDLEGYVKLREHAPLPISSGEVQTTRDPEISEWGNPASFYWSLQAEYIGLRELTRGSEPSQYPEEEKTNQ